MATFNDTIKQEFYTNGSLDYMGQGDWRVCLLDANGKPIGSEGFIAIQNAMKKGVKYVDMGLPSGTLWASQNLGATTPYSHGWYATWGDDKAYRESEHDFSQANYTSSHASTISGNLPLFFDVAARYLGYGWRMPTKEHFEELLYYSNVSWGMSGNDTYCELTSTQNGNKLIFPMCGYCDGDSYPITPEMIGCYWTSSWYSSTTAVQESFSYDDEITTEYEPRRKGCSIRPIMNLY